MGIGPEMDARQTLEEINRLTMGESLDGRITAVAATFDVMALQALRMYLYWEFGMD